MMGWDTGTDDETVMECHVTVASKACNKLLPTHLPHILLHHTTFVSLLVTETLLSSHTYTCIKHTMSDTLDFQFDTD